MNGQSVDFVRQSWRQLLPQILPPAKAFVNGEPSYICPFCSHGAHGDGLTFDPTSPGRLHCFGPCGWSGDIIDLYRALKQCSFQDAITELSQLLGLHDQAPSEDHLHFIRLAQKAFPNSPADQYLQERGISTNTARNGGAGYCKEWRHPSVSTAVPLSPRLIIPTSSKSYLARDIRPVDSMSNTERRYSKQKVGSVHLYRSKKLMDSSKPIFIVEGELDALSLMEVGCNAIALGSVSCINLLLKDLAQGPKPAQPLVIALDNDVAGYKATKRLLDALSGQGLVAFDGHSISGQCKDANEALIADRIDFEQRVREIEIDVEKEYQNIEPQSSADVADGIVLVSTYDYLETKYDEEVTQFALFKNRRTGFSNLDGMTSFYPGLYALGGISSLGKTTFVHQLADQVAGMGEHVLYFPIEQSPAELVSKGISRMTYQLDPESAVQSIQIRSGYSSDSVQNAKLAYMERVKTLFIADCSFNTTVMDIRDAVMGHADMTGSAPIVIVDYLQALRSPDSRLIQRDAIDVALRTLKDMQTELSATVIIVSSLNRVNYMVPIGFESFKESGGIEYTCDVIWGIDLLCMDDPLFDSQGHIKTKREIINAAKVAIPREVRLICLKNRYGISSYSAVFDYLPGYDIFIPRDHEAIDRDQSTSANAANQIVPNFQRNERPITEEERAKILRMFEA